MEWFPDLNGGKDYLTFSFISHKCPIYSSSDDGVGGPQPITKLALSRVVSKVKDECEGAIWGLVSKLEKQFPWHEVMIALGVIYLQFWATNTIEAKKKLLLS
jgi:hypothetical protein